MKVSIIIPAYNERPNLPILLKEAEKFVKEHKLSWEFVIVDDGSTDDTSEYLNEAVKKYPFLKTVRHSINRGLTQALITGYKHTTGDALVFFPADMQFSFDDVLRMAEKMDEGYDLVAGRKQGKYGKKFVSSIYNALSRKIFDIPVHDMNSIKIMKRDILGLLPGRKDWHRYIVPLAKENGYSMAEIDVTLYPRRMGHSKFSGSWRIIVGLLDLIAVKFQLSFVRKPMLFFGTSGIASFILSFLTFLLALLLRMLKHGYRPLLYLVIVFFLSGLILLSMGFLGEMTAGILDKLENKEK